MSKEFDNVYVVILAGGSGTRFWPKSRHQSPKQLCIIGDADKTMLEITLDRLNGFVPKERRLIVTHQDQAPQTERLVGNSVQRVLAEPQARNTANALALAALEVQQMHRQSVAKDAAGKPAVMISLHADHIIKDVPRFINDLKKAVTVAETGQICLLGIKPRYPETGFGYIEQGAPLNLSGAKDAYKVQSFREKPALELATEYVASGRFLWNAGLFVWQIPVILEELKTYLPMPVEKLSDALGAETSFSRLPRARMAEVYGALPKIAIDNAVLEVSKKVSVIVTDFGWQDVGSWDAMAQCFAPDAKGNLAFGDTVLIDAQDTTVDSDGPFVACLGTKDLVVVAAKGAVLVCPKERAQDVKKIVEWLQAAGRTEYL